jgi:hypothetical protein
MVAPIGIESEYVDSGKPNRRQIVKLTGILAADERVKNAFTPDSLNVMNVMGKGFSLAVNQ